MKSGIIALTLCGIVVLGAPSCSKKEENQNNGNNTESLVEDLPGIDPEEEAAKAREEGRRQREREREKKRAERIAAANERAKKEEQMRRKEEEARKAAVAKAEAKLRVRKAESARKQFVGRTFPELTIKGTTYANVKVTETDDTSITFFHANGAASASYADLPKNLQKLLHFSPEAHAAAVASKKEEETKNKEAAVTRRKPKEEAPAPTTLVKADPKVTKYLSDSRVRYRKVSGEIGLIRKTISQKLGESSKLYHKLNQGLVKVTDRAKIKKLSNEIGELMLSAAKLEGEADALAIITAYTAEEYPAMEEQLNTYMKKAKEYHLAKGTHRKLKRQLDERDDIQHRSAVKSKEAEKVMQKLQRAMDRAELKTAKLLAERNAMRVALQQARQGLHRQPAKRR